MLLRSQVHLYKGQSLQGTVFDYIQVETALLHTCVSLHLGQPLPNTVWQLQQGNEKKNATVLDPALICGTVNQIE